MRLTDKYQLYSKLLTYPDSGSFECAGALADGLGSEKIRNFIEALPRHVNELQELYVQTFEVNPSCCLYAGFSIFGESYKRGELLVGLKSALREAQIINFESEDRELADFIPSLLQLIAKQGITTEDKGSVIDSELSVEIVEHLVMSALYKAKKSLEQNPYAYLVSSLIDELHVDFKIAVEREIEL